MSDEYLPYMGNAPSLHLFYAVCPATSYEDYEGDMINMDRRKCSLILALPMGDGYAGKIVRIQCQQPIMHIGPHRFDKHDSLWDINKHPPAQAFTYRVQIEWAIFADNTLALWEHIAKGYISRAHEKEANADLVDMLNRNKLYDNG